MAETPLNYFSTNPLLGDAATCGKLLDFGFPAVFVRVYNTCAVPLFVNLRGLNACGMSTGVEAWFSSGETILPLPETPIGSLAVWSTSTGAGGHRISVLALGR